MKFISFLCLAILPSLCAQESIEKTLEKFNSGSIPYISVPELAETSDLLLLDARSREEYSISHLKDALWVGYEDFDPVAFRQKVPDRDTPLLVYCSVGVRSEEIGERLREAGYNHVQNLYGGIFEWKNQNHPVYDTNGQETERVHAYDNVWGKLLNKGEKVY